MTSLFIIGPTGAGKTTIGKLLAEDLGLQFFDTDQEIIKRTGVSIPTIFEYEGERGFRAREQQVIAQLAALDDVVIATGGGAILDAQNRSILAQNGTVIYLEVSIAEQLARTRNDKNRPLLQNNIEQSLQNMAKSRNHLYAQLSAYTFTTDNSSARKLATRIIKTLEAAT